MGDLVTSWFRLRNRFGGDDHTPRWPVAEWGSLEELEGASFCLYRMAGNVAVIRPGATMSFSKASADEVCMTIRDPKEECPELNATLKVEVHPQKGAGRHWLMGEINGAYIFVFALETHQSGCRRIVYEVFVNNGDHLMHLPYLTHESTGPGKDAVDPPKMDGCPTEFLAVAEKGGVGFQDDFGTGYERPPTMTAGFSTEVPAVGDTAGAGPQDNLGSDHERPPVT
jgi:hypothetical protein